jgi:hypothetical protein
LKSIDNQREFLRNLSNKLGFELNNTERWYKVKLIDFRRYRGASLLKHYDDSISKLLSTVLSELNWDISRFPSKRINRTWRTIKTRKDFVLEIMAKLGITASNFEKWYDVTFDTIKEFGGAGLLNEYYHGSVIHFLKEMFPEHKWEIIRFTKVPRHHWETLAAQKKFMDDLGFKLGFNGDLSKWYSVSPGTISQNGGSGLLNHFNKPLPEILRILYPEHAWDVNKFVIRNRGYWELYRNQREFMKNLARDLNIRDGEYDKWYKLVGREILKRNGGGFLKHFDGSIIAVVRAIFPEHEWDVTKFNKKPHNYWTETKNQREFLSDIGVKLGITAGQYERWYGVSNRDIIKEGGASLLKSHDDSISSLVMAVFPEFEWEIENFDRKPRHYWKSLENQRTFLESLTPKLGFSPQDLEGWYKVGLKDLVKYGGTTLIGNFDNSVYAMLASVYPEHLWDVWRFQRTSTRARKIADVHDVIKDVEEKLEIKSPEDWYRIGASQLDDLGTLYYFQKNGGIAKVLTNVYPNVVWDKSKFVSKRRRRTTSQQEGLS